MYLTAAETLYRMIGFDGQLIFDSLVTGVNIFILFFALSYFLFDPAQKLLKDRSEKIKSEIENAKKQEADAIALKEQYEQKLTETRNEIDKMMTEAKKNSKIVADDIVEKAREEAASIVNRANKEIEQEKAKAVEELRSKVIDISTLLATKIIKENVNVKSEEKLFEETLKEIGDVAWRD